MSRPDQHIFVNSLVSARDLSPQVVIELGAVKTQVSASKAKEIALMILEASEAAMSDAVLVHFLVKKTGAPVDSSIGIIMQEFREFRDEQQRKEAEGR